MGKKQGHSMYDDPEEGVQSDGGTEGSRLWQRELPYLVMLVLAIGGVAYTNLSPRPTVDYWQILVPIYAAICVFIEWPRLASKEARWRLLATQALHWGTMFAAMRLMFLPQVQNMLNSDAIGLGVLALLSLGTILAGIHAGIWQICVVGLLLAVAVPAIALLEQTVLLILIIALVVLGSIAAFLWFRYRRQT
jgi:hypothetical protein